MSENTQWESHGMVDGEYYVMVHKPCETKVQILIGHEAVCSKCQPEEWARLKAQDTR